jgi:cytochrome b6-f complex iron-sulfur subunit
MDPRGTQTGDGISRRTVLLAGTGTALGGVVLTACAGGGKSALGSSTLAKVDDVPVGGAVSATGSDGGPVIVSRPSAGEVVAFSAICTHMGCTVAPANSILKCPCHGSTYNLATGKNTGGPAPRPLARIPVKVEGGEVVET